MEGEVAKSSKPIKDCFDKYIKFISWLRTAEVVTKTDFMKHAASKWQKSEDKIVFKTTKENTNEICYVRQDKNA